MSNTPGNLKSSTGGIDDTLWSQVSALASGTLDAAGREQLNERLRTDDAAVTFYVAYMRMHAQLGWASRKTTERSAEEEGKQKDEGGRLKDEKNGIHPSSFIPHPSEAHPTFVRRKSRVQRILDHEFGMGISVAILTMVVGLVWASVTHLPDFAKQEEQEDEQPAVVNIDDVFVARLDQRHNVTWLHKTEPRPDRPKLIPGQRLAISAGLLKINYLTGATVVIEGPADFYVGYKEAEDTEALSKDQGERKQGTVAELARSEAGRGSLSRSGDQGKNQSTYHSNSGYLALGKLVARCNTAGSKGFTIETPSSRVEDLGTEFASHVDELGATTVKVYEGKVSLRASHAGAGSVAVILAANDTATVAADGVFVAASPTSFRFVRTVPVRDNLGVASMKGRLRVLRTPPRSIEFGAVESSDELTMFLERRGVTLSEDVSVSIKKPGTYQQFAENTSVVPAGTRVDSYYFSLDPKDAPKDPVQLTGSITFERPVVGIICRERPLLNTNSLFKSEATAYPAKYHAVDDRDHVVLSPDRRTLQLTWTAAGATGDQMRVLVESKPASAIEGADNNPRVQ